MTCTATNEKGERCIYGAGHSIAHHRFSSEIQAVTHDFLPQTQDEWLDEMTEVLEEETGLLDDDRAQAQADEAAGGAREKRRIKTQHPGKEASKP